MDEVTIGDKIYISSKRAAEITGYAKDYVGQLCREGHIQAKMVGRGWYVYEPSIRAHRFGTEAQTTEVTQQEQESSSSWNAATYTAETPEYMPIMKPSGTEIAHEPVSNGLPEEDETIAQMQTAWREWFDARRTPEDDQPETESDTVNEVSLDVAAQSVTEFEEEAYIQAVSEEPEPVAVPVTRVHEEVVAAPVPVYEDYAPYGEAYEEQSYTPKEVSIPVQRIRSFDVAPEAPVSAPRWQVPSEEERELGRVVRERKVSRRTRSNGPVIALFIAIALLAISIAVIGTGVASNYLLTSVGKNPVTEFLVGERTIKNTM